MLLISTVLYKLQSTWPTSANAQVTDQDFMGEWAYSTKVPAKLKLDEKRIQTRLKSERALNYVL